MSDQLILPERYRLQVEKILRDKVPAVDVWAYGSRVDGTNHDASDLDLVLRPQGLQPLPIPVLNDLREAFDESRIPIIVDVHDWASLPVSCHEAIEYNYIPIATQQ